MKHQEILDECGEILKKQGITIRDGSPELINSFKLALKLKEVDIAFELLIKYIKKFEDEMTLQKYKDKIPVNTLVTLIFLFESFIIQLRMAMDFWTQFIGKLPGFDNLGDSFNKHKKNISRVKDKSYSDYVMKMDWFDKMKKIRDRFKSGKINIFKFDEKLNGFVILSIYPPQKASPRKKVLLLRDYCKELYDKSIAYRNFVFTNFK